MTDPDDLVAFDDDALLAQLGQALDALDPVPFDALDAARAAAALGRADDALAELLFDSLLDEPDLAMRGDVVDVRSVAFQGRSHRLDLELLDDGDVVLGQLDPAASAGVEVETRTGVHHTMADDLGRFRFGDVRGPLRLRVRIGDDELLTPWITW